MPGTDFFDDDLVRQRDRASRIKLGPGDVPADAAPAAADGGVSRPVADLNLTRMARYRKEVDEQEASKVEELEKLRHRQDQIEKEKVQLEDTRRKHDDYVRGKREMTDHLRRNVVLLERREVETQRLAELLGASRLRFKEMLEGVEAINEETWPEGQIRDELGKALGVIEQTRMEFNKTMARIEAVQGEPAGTESKSAVLFEEHGGAEEKTFGYWLKVGLAVSLPLVVTIVIVLIVLLVARTTGMM